MRARLALAVILAGFVPAPSSAASLSALRLSFVRVASGFSSPVAIGATADGRLFVVEQAGRVRVRLTNGSVPSTPYLNISSKVNSGGERGMLGIAFHPSFSSNGFVFASYTDGSGALVVARFHASSSGASTVAASTETDILTVAHPSYANHNGGQLAFGPDGYLYIGTGDGGSAYDPSNNAHDTSKLLGKILRIDVNRACSAKPYCIPPGNPFGNEVFQYGLRNPWRFSFDRSGGRMWIADVGQNTIEEIDSIDSGVAGKNFGWDCWEGTLRVPSQYNGSYCTPLSSTTQPVTEYNHNAGDCAVIGGFVYRGARYASSLGGIYLYGDYCTGSVRAYSNGSTRLVYHHSGQITSFGEDASHEMYVADASGGVYHVTASGQTTAPPPAPTRSASASPSVRTSSPSPKHKPSPTPTPTASPSPSPSSGGIRTRTSGAPWSLVGILLGALALGAAATYAAVRRRDRAG